MKKQFLVGILFLGIISITKAQTKNLENLLFELPDVIFRKIETAKGFESTYELKIKQPKDHTDPSKGFFYQRVFLTHKGFDRPTVIITEGYKRSKNKIYELTELIGANQIDVEHRFFGKSIPEPRDYKYLNLKQATADLHQVRELLGRIYKSKWLSTGISKGGATTIFYKYFYPNDVDVSVPYVAPINRSFEDPRIYSFLDQVGSNDCRKKIKDFQVRLFKNRDKIMPLLKFYSKGRKSKFTYVPIEKAFEYAILEYPFSFWQFGSVDCNEIPDKNASVEDLVLHMNRVSDIHFYSDAKIDYLEPHYYQSAEEMGYYGYEIKKFRKYLKFIPKRKNPHATFIPSRSEKIVFNDETLVGVNKWLDKEADKLIYIYGEIDTWSATAVPENSKVDSEWFFMEGKHHGNARIKNMNNSEKERLIATLEKWLSIKIEESGSTIIHKGTNY